MNVIIFEPVEPLNEILTPAVVGRARVRVQLPIIAVDESERPPAVERG